MSSVLNLWNVKTLGVNHLVYIKQLESVGVSESSLDALGTSINPVTV